MQKKKTRGKLPMRQKTGFFCVVSIVDPDIPVTNLILAWFLIKKNANIWMIATDKHYARLIQTWNNHNHIFVIVCSHNCKTIEVWMLISIMHICKTALKENCHPLNVQKEFSGQMMQLVCNYDEKFIKNELAFSS